MFKKSKFFLIGIFFISSNINAQQNTTHANMLWFNYNNSISINNKWAVVNDVQVRSRDWAIEWSQFAIRSGISYKLNNQLSATAGFAWWGNVRYINLKPVIANEWRPWQEIAYQIKKNKITFSQRIRSEQRLLQQVVNGKKLAAYDYRFRLRYRFEIGFPVNKEKITASVGNEIMINPGHFNDSLCFDQNRTFLILNFKLSATTSFQWQYIKLFQWKAANRVLDNQDVFRFGIQQKFSSMSIKKH